MRVRTEYNREWRAANPEKVAAHRARYRERHPEKIREAARRALLNPESIARRAAYKQRPSAKAWMRDYIHARRLRHLAVLACLKAKPCADCGGRFPPECMDFDHVRGEKRIAVSSMTGYSEESVFEELAKCEVVCSNCHRTRTAARIREPIV